MLDEGVGPAQRNQALIDDAAPAAQYQIPDIIIPPAAMGAMAGLGEVIAVAAQDEVEHARKRLEEPEAASEPLVEPAAAPEEPAPTPVNAADDLLRIKGLGPKLQALLASLGVTSFAQIAAWGDSDLDALDDKLGPFAGRPRRDNWVEQAALLSSGDTAAYEERFGKL